MVIDLFLTTFLEIINKKVSYSKVQEINVSQISENEIRNYLKRPPRWKLESKIFMLTKSRLKFKI